MADSDVSLSNSPMIPTLTETLDESSSPIASVETHVDNVQSLSISSSDGDRDNHDWLSVPRPNLDGYSSSSSEETQFISPPVDFECSSEFPPESPESQILPLNHSGSNNWFQIGSTSQALEDIDNVLDTCSSDLPELDQPRTSNLSPGCGSDDGNSKKECHTPLLLGFHQELLKIEEPITGVGAGLWNLGNTCFLNSVLQCLTHSVPLIQSLCSYKYRDPCNCGNDFCVIRTLRDHIEAALRPQRYTMSPYYFFNNLNYFSPDFQRYQQEDAHEFLQAFLDKLEGCCLDRRSYHGFVSSQDVNIVEQVFGGRLVSGLRCCNCNTISETFEQSVGLSLEIEDVDNLWNALESFTCVEKLDEQLTCDNCDEKVSKEKQLLLDKLPLVATFHLKRFKNNGLFMEKIFKHVKIPLEIDLAPYMRGNQEKEISTKYHLYAFVEHLGYSLAFGHYSSYVRSAPKIWHKFDDEQVTRVDEETVLSQDSYILFYAREGTPWVFRAYEEVQSLLEASLRNSSPKSVLDSTNPECLSEISYENAHKSNQPCDSAELSNQHVKIDEDFVSLSNERTEDVFLSAVSSGEDSATTELLDSCETDDSYNPCTEEEPDSFIATETAATVDVYIPLLMVQNQDSSTKHQDGTFQMQMEETTKNQEEPCEQPSLVADSKEAEYVNGDLMKKHPSHRARELLDQASFTSGGSPPKKIKTE